MLTIHSKFGSINMISSTLHFIDIQCIMMDVFTILISSYKPFLAFLINDLFRAKQIILKDSI